MSTPLRKVVFGRDRRAPTIKQIIEWRKTQSLWLSIAADQSMRSTARDNAKAQADRYEAMIRG